MPSIAIPVSLRGQLLYSTRIFDPLSLFANNEPGIWLDPSDVANLDWRRNLLTYTEQFDNAAWLKQNAGTGLAPVVTANAAAAPDGTTTADLVVFNRGAGNLVADRSVLVQAPSGITPTTYVGSIWLKAATSGDIGKQIGIRTVGGTTYGVVTLTDDWVRVTRLETGSTSNFELASRGTITVDNQVSVHVWGAQLELGSVATDYQRISDVNTEVLERFPRTTMFQDRAGSTAVTTPGQSVGLRLDKSKGLVLGSELVTNGTFDSAASWTVSAQCSIGSGVANIISTDGSFQSVVQNRTLTGGSTYELSFDVVSYTSGTPRVTFTGASVDISFATGTGRRVARFFVPTTATSGLTFTRLAGVTSYSIDNVSLKELPGNHAVANSDAARGIYGIEPLGGRRNLLTFTEEFDNSVWLKASGGGGSVATVSSNAAASPTGTVTADLVTIARTTTTMASFITQRLADDGVTKTKSVYLKAFSGADVGKVLDFWTFDGTVANRNAVTLTADWVRVVLPPATLAAGANREQLALGFLDNGSLSPNTGTVQFLIWGAQLETGSTATAYQRVTTQYDVTEAGKQTLHYVQYDGSDDGYVTPTITPGIDKVQVFAGVRKLSDAAVDVLVELGPTNVTTNGTWGLQPVGITPDQPAFSSRGTIRAPSFAAWGTSPRTGVLTGIGDISGDLAALRVNGTQIAQSTADQGTGNYLAYPIYIGRRGGTTLPFNGRDYGIITRFGANLDASTIAATESWLNQKTGAF